MIHLAVAALLARSVVLGAKRSPCVDSFDAAVLQEAPPWLSPGRVARLRAAGIPLDGVVAAVKLVVDANGRPSEATIYRSSENMDMDVAAIAAAYRSTYLPKVVRCHAVASTYRLVVPFAGLDTAVAPTPVDDKPRVFATLVAAGCIAGAFLAFLLGRRTERLRNRGRES